MPNFIFKPEHISHIRTVIAEKNADDKVKVWENSLLSPLRRELKHYILSALLQIVGGDKLIIPFC
ncbi:hypothetical protein AM418_005371 [Klebsiella pneumoniae]|nr:hypothetical protein AM418_005371 [Klebsiella pneumoniae]